MMYRVPDNPEGEDRGTELTSDIDFVISLLTPETGRSWRRGCQITSSITVFGWSRKSVPPYVPSVHTLSNNGTSFQSRGL